MGSSTIELCLEVDGIVVCFLLVNIVGIDFGVLGYYSLGMGKKELTDGPLHAFSRGGPL